MEARSDVWPYFDPFKDGSDGKKKARCKRCHRVLVAVHGTSSLWKHVDKCWGKQPVAGAVRGQQQQHHRHSDSSRHRPFLHGPRPVQPGSNRIKHLRQQQQRTRAAAVVVPREPPQKALCRDVRQGQGGKWVAEIRHCLGEFDTAEEAALACDQAAHRLLGDAAPRNFPGGGNAAPPSRASLGPSADTNRLQATAAAAAAASSVEEEEAPVLGSLRNSYYPAVQRCRSMHISEALQMQIEVQRRLQMQIEVQRRLHERLEYTYKQLCNN